MVDNHWIPILKDYYYIVEEVPKFSLIVTDDEEYQDKSSATRRLEFLQSWTKIEENEDPDWIKIYLRLEWQMQVDAPDMMEDSENKDLQDSSFGWKIRMIDFWIEFQLCPICILVLL
ncbi:hypothetical protein SUGI_0712910 [Cryptomeria japonica]|nr:hypothetical protein SUGI_0712910 [Cryptomeria japonica]